MSSAAARTIACVATTFCTTFALAAPAYAASYVATSATLKSVFAKAGAGDTIVLNGTFGQTFLMNRSFATPLRIDARNARFEGTLTMRRLSGVSVTGGQFGDGTGSWQNAGTIRVQDSSHIGFTNPTLAGNGLGASRGLTFTRTTDYQVSDGSFSGFRLALGATSTTNGVFANNAITRSTSDGINIVDSHKVVARNNSCSGGVPSPGSHTDCIQLWSLAGNPVQSDIQLLYNSAYGPTQGFTSFNPANGGGLRISMIGNRVDTNKPQGIACYACVDSIFTDNVLTTLPGAPYQTRINIIGGRNNIIANNSIGGIPALPPPPPGPGPGLTNNAPFGSDAALFAFDDGSAGYDAEIWGSLTSIPEPSTWLQLITGFGLIGSLVRRRRSGELRLQEIG